MQKVKNQKFAVLQGTEMDMKIKDCMQIALEYNLVLVKDVVHFFPLRFDHRKTNGSTKFHNCNVNSCTHYNIDMPTRLVTVAEHFLAE